MRTFTDRRSSITLVNALRAWERTSGLNKIGVMDMSDIMDSGQNRLYTTFPNIFSFLSADLDDLSYIQKNHLSKKLVLARKKLLPRKTRDWTT